MITQSLVMAMILAESSFNPLARSHAGATGLMQLTSIGVQEVHQTFGLAPNPDLADPEANILYGVLLLSHYYEQTGSIRKAVAMYNCGYAYPWPEETRKYVARVMAARWDFDPTFDRIPGTRTKPYEQEVTNALEYLEQF